VHGSDTPFPAAPYAPSGFFDKGSVLVMSMDSERLPVGPRAPQVYLRLRLLAENKGDDSAWLFNPNDQMLGYDGGLLSPSYSQTSASRPVLAVVKGSRGWIDLYYPLPADADPPAGDAVVAGAARGRHRPPAHRVRAPVRSRRPRRRGLRLR
jgi:hypothetical protein